MFAVGRKPRKESVPNRKVRKMLPTHFRSREAWEEQGRVLPQLKTHPWLPPLLVNATTSAPAQLQRPGGLTAECVFAFSSAHLVPASTVSACYLVLLSSAQKEQPGVCCMYRLFRLVCAANLWCWWCVLPVHGDASVGAGVHC